ncbi:MAG TPA: NAD(P)-dependent oxidoreductase [Verrucomicrobiae bacterium]|nr:NAD(P)-dependent oxidoreductase [Verrucomicrobiae bacterium]
MKQIGIVGAGIMASGMAQNFLRHSYKVTLWNRSPEHLKPLLESGATKAETPGELTKRCDIVIECVSDDEASKSVWLGKQGIVEAATSEKVLVASSSLSLDWIDELVALCSNKGLKFMDMPLTGSRAGAENGTLRLLIGANESVLNSVRSDLEAISEKIYLFGKPGMGMRFKLVLNTLIGIHMNAAAQARDVATKAGIDPVLFAHALVDGNMGPISPATKLVLESVNWPEGHVNFAVQWLEKDLRYAKKMAEAYGIDFDLLNDTQKDYADYKNAGYGAADVTSISKWF